jgi:hypothetical protein
MKSKELSQFRKFFSEDGGLAREIIARGYLPEKYKSADGNHFLYKKEENSDLVVLLMMSFGSGNTCNVSFLLGSNYVGEIFRSAKLSIGDSIEEPGWPEIILAVDLLWLRRNANPDVAEKYKCDYNLQGNAIERILEDIDSVGNNFIGNFLSKNSQADMLMTLDDYPKNIRWSGGPRSVSPYIYSAVLFFGCGEIEMAKSVLTKGLIAYATIPPRPAWEEIRLIDYQSQTKKLLDYLGTLPSIN